MLIDITISVVSLSKFNQEERSMLVGYASLISQSDNDKAIILYDSELAQMLTDLEDDYADSYLASFRSKMSSLLKLEVDQYKFD